MSEARPGERRQGRRVANRYQLLEPIGRGGMGIVWRAHDELLDRAVAVKEVRYPGDPEDDEVAELNRRTLREARAAGRLSHPNVVVVHDVIEENGRPWIVMQLVDSRSLGQVLRDDGPLPMRMTAEIGLQILEALRSAHAAGVLHRDVKPENVLLTDDGRVVLTDFGIARMETDTTMTRTGLVGTPAFIAPERLRGYSAQRESDLWSLGATLYAAVEGRPPHDKGMAMATMHAVLNDEPEPALRAGRLGAVLSGLLEKNPTERLTADQAERMLRSIAEDRSSAPMTSQRTLPATPLPMPATSPPRKQPKEPRQPREGARPRPETPRPGAADGAEGAVPAPRAPDARGATPAPADVRGRAEALEQVQSLKRAQAAKRPAAKDSAAAGQAQAAARRQAHEQDAVQDEDAVLAQEVPGLPATGAGQAEEVQEAEAASQVQAAGAEDQAAAAEEAGAEEVRAAGDTAAHEVAEEAASPVPGTPASEKPSASARPGKPSAPVQPVKPPASAPVKPSALVQPVRPKAAPVQPVRPAEERARPAAEPVSAADQYERHRPTQIPRQSRDGEAETRPESRKRPYASPSASEAPGAYASAAPAATSVGPAVTSVGPAATSVGPPLIPLSSGDDEGGASGRRPVPIPRIVLVAVPLVLVVAAVALWLGARNADTPSGGTSASGEHTSAPATDPATGGSAAPSSGASPAPSAPSSPSSSPTETPKPSSSPEPTALGPGDVPDGWHKYKHSSGFSVALPKGWSVDGRGNGEVRFRGDAHTYLEVHHTSSPESDALKVWQRDAPGMSRNFPGYSLVAIREVKGYWKTAADWEFTFGDGRFRSRVIDRGFVTDKNNGYALLFKTQDEDWKKKKKLFDTLAATFKPAK
ncbi:protein kinase [Sphaerisporangium sp. NBC_01403]|uniref:serine/threonine-protein kinase n=1 Tax=Sphaerisporangium sp. NBC_01403 TaxID=2903599 RepID=UPI00325327E9